MSETSIPALIETLNSFRSYSTQPDKISSGLLDVFSERLAKDEAFRCKLPQIAPSLWKSTSNAWVSVEVDSDDQPTPASLILSLARFTRNLVAGIPENQSQVFASEPEIRRILHYLTSFSQLGDESLYPLTRMLVQTLSNLVTLNDVLATRFWNLYITLPEDQNIITRLLESPDIRAINATLVLIINSINAEAKALSRLASPIGQRIVIRLLDRTEEWVSHESEDDEDEAFTLAYRLFERLLEQDLAAPLYRSLKIDGEPTTPHQTTFLKLLDSYLRRPREDRHKTNFAACDYSFLTDSFSYLCSYSQRAIRRSLGDESPSLPAVSCHPTSAVEHIPENGLKELDLRLPKVSAAIILISQCLTTILLHLQETQDNTKGLDESGYTAILVAIQATGFVENLIGRHHTKISNSFYIDAVIFDNKEMLRLVDRLLPRIVFGREVVTTAEVSTHSENPIDTTGFAYLKRDIVRLLGTITYGRRDIQERVRKCGGIQVVMNLCVIDERNPYLQEHALFALRNILYENLDNQAVVDGFRTSVDQT